MIKLFNLQRLFLLLTAVVSLCAAVPQSVHAGWTLVQHPRGTCNTNPCTLTVSATVGGHVGVVVYYQGSGATPTLTSVSDGTSTWVVNAACGSFDASIGGLEAGYTLSIANAITSITVTPSGAGFNGEAEFLEYASTGPAVAFDSCGGAFNTPGSGTPPGKALTLTGANDVIVQGIITNTGNGNPPTAISGSYTNPADFFSGPVNAGYGLAGNMNTSSGAAPTWTVTNTPTSVVMGIAFKDGSFSGSRFSRALPTPVTPIYPSAAGRWALTEKERARA